MQWWGTSKYKMQSNVPSKEPNEYVNICKYEQVHTKVNNTYLYKHIYTHKHI